MYTCQRFEQGALHYLQRCRAAKSDLTRLEKISGDYLQCPGEILKHVVVNAVTMTRTRLGLNHLMEICPEGHSTAYLLATLEDYSSITVCLIPLQFRRDNYDRLFKSTIDIISWCG